MGDHETDEMSSILEVFGISAKPLAHGVGAGIAGERKTVVRPPWHFDWLIKWMELRGLGKESNVEPQL